MTLSRAAFAKRLDVIVSPGECLALVKSWATHSRVVHAHQSRSIAAHVVAKILLGDDISRTGPARGPARRTGPQGLSNSRMQRSRSKRLSVWDFH